MPEVVWICERCSKPIAGDEGYVFISYREVTVAEAEQRAANSRYEALRAENPVGAVRMSDVWETPELATWHVIHSACGEEDDSVGYSIPISKIGTFRDLFRWTTHLLHKRWLPATNWLDMMEHAAYGGVIGSD